MKKVFVIDCFLIPAFILSSYSGIELHIAGHGNSHEVWHNWAVFHVVTSLLFLTAITFHIRTHWGWYKGLVKNGIGRKSKVTVVLSLLFLFVGISGISLLGIDGANSEMGRWHYGMGIAMSIISVGHTLKRFPTLRKSLKSEQ